ncbi:hypothetical protein F5Y13DRAFT_148997 [Hypoxylon sp. FL1857]|nr:hypothetical protein F5Y13DRAFT_148997 [Hypoxylon sp. FL1857]
MDRASGAGSGDPLSCPDVAESVRQRDRRREKPQLSCNFCRRRKVRCDRQLPCNTCVNKGLAVACTYTAGPQRKGMTGVGERIQELEALVRSLSQQQQQSQHTPAVSPAGLFTNSPARSIGATSGESPQSVSGYTGSITPVVSTDEDAAAASITYASSPDRKDQVSSPTPSEPGSIRVHSHGANYVSSVHWAAVLDSISELKDHYEKEKEEEAIKMTSFDYVPLSSPGPRLLYEPVQATKADILASIPDRPVVDRLVARYFNAHGIASVLHSGKFLREYESFWQDPAATPYTWIGLLFSTMCLATQLQQMTENPDTLSRLHVFRERTVHCLILGQYTKGGTHVLETLVNHCASEVFMCKDADIGLWLLLGILVQLALSLGYHRDPRNFSNISPFASEMRRRLWTAVTQMDLRLSSQMGLPRLLKSHQCDTSEPRNLFDSDFDETTVDFPPSRPETEVTPILFNLAKNRIDAIGGMVSDLIADTREHPYSEIMELDRKLQETETLLPPAFRWEPLSRSFMVPPQIVLSRIWLKLAVQRLIIWLHRKYLAPSHSQARYEYSRNACVQAAINILEFQQLVEEEIQPGGQLHPVRWMLTPLIQSTYLLGMSVLCYYVQLARSTPDVPLDSDTDARIHALLRNTYPLWLRSSTVSRDAREAVEHLNLMLGLHGQQGVRLADEAADSPVTPQDSAISLDQITWDAYQECIANFPATFSADFMALDVPGSSPAINLSMRDLLLANASELDEWIMGEGTLPHET